MNHKLFALAMTLAVTGTMAGKAFANPPISQVDPTIYTQGQASPILGEHADVEDSLLGSLNNNTVNVDASTHRQKIEDSFNNKPEDSYNKIWTSGNQSPAMSNSEIEDSAFQNAKGKYALNLADHSEIEGSNFGDTTTKGSMSPILGKNAEIEDSNFVGGQYTKAPGSANLVDSEIKDSNLVGSQTSSAPVSPNLVDSEIKDSNLANQYAGGPGLNTNLQDSKVDDSNFAYQTSTGDASPNLQRSNGNDIANQHTSGDYSNNVQDADVTDSMNHVESKGPLSPTMWDSTISDTQFVNGDIKQDGLVNVNGTTDGGDIKIGNVARDNATIFDGDVSFGGGGYGPAGLLGLGGGGHTDANVNTGLMTGSLLGNESQQANYAGIAVNGYLGSEGHPSSGGVTLNNTQTSNTTVFGTTH